MSVPDLSVMTSGSESGSRTKSRTDTTAGTPSTNSIVGAGVQTGPVPCAIADGPSGVGCCWVGAGCWAGAGAPCGDWVAGAVGINEPNPRLPEATVWGESLSLRQPASWVPPSSIETVLAN